VCGDKGCERVRECRDSHEFVIVCRVFGDETLCFFFWGGRDCVWGLKMCEDVETLTSSRVCAEYLAMKL